MKDYLLTNNGTDATLTAGGVIPLGSAVHGYGNSIVLNGNAINVKKGAYRVLATVSFAPTATSTVNVLLNANGMPIPNASSEVTAAAGVIVTVPLLWDVRRGCCADSLALTLTVDSDVTIYNVTVEVEAR